MDDGGVGDGITQRSAIAPCRKAIFHEPTPGAPRAAGWPGPKPAPLQPFSEGSDDRGVATVFMCMGAALVLAVTALAIHLGAAVLARQRAETAADLAALAGAALVLQGPDLVCAGVVRVAGANSAMVDSCVVQGTDVLVAVAASVQAGPISGTVVARARAGPVLRITDGG